MRHDHALDGHLCGRDAVQVLDGRAQHLRPAILEQPGRIAQLQLHIDLAALDIDSAHATGADRIRFR